MAERKLESLDEMGKQTSSRKLGRATGTRTEGGCKKKRHGRESVSSLLNFQEDLSEEADFTCTVHCINGIDVSRIFYLNYRYFPI